MTLLVNHPERKIIHLQLRQNEVLQAMTDAERDELEQRLDIVDVAKGDYLVHQGVHEMEQYFVIEGILKRVVSNADAKEMILRFTDERGIETSYAAWRLNTPASPHLSAELDGVTIDIETLTPPDVAGPLVIEGAGGALVPVTRDTLFADVFARWALPVIVCARTGLGTINHSLLTIEALRSRGVPIHGIAFIGAPMPDSEAIIPALSGVRRLGRLPRIDPLTSETLAAAFAANFDMGGFR